MVFNTYGTKFTATKRRCVPRGVRCESCSWEYVYYLERRSEGTSFSFLHLNDTSAQNQAKDEAEIELVRRLFQGCEPVPCPECGHIQQHMFRRARRLRYAWMDKAGVCCLLLAVIFLVPALITTGVYRTKGEPEAFFFAVVTWVCFGVCCLGTAFFPLWRSIANRRWDPNSEDAESRKQRGQALAVSRAEFDKANSGHEHLFPRGPESPEVVTLDSPQWLTTECDGKGNP